jgi:hypothetical protein
VFFRLCVYPFTSLPQQAEHRLSNRLHEVRGGQAELVIPAETGIGGSNMSPNGKFLIWGSEELKGTFLLDTTTGREQNITEVGGGIWLQDDVIIQENKDGGYFLIEIPSMDKRAINPLEGIDNITTQKLNELFEGIKDIYVVEAVGGFSAPIILSLDPQTPIVFKGGVTSKMIEEVNFDFTLVPAPWTYSKKEWIAPNGRYYAQIVGQECCAFHVVDSQTGEEIAYVRRDGRYPRILGWSPDSTAIYFKFRVGGASGGILHPYEPVFKLVLDAPQSGIAPLPNSHVQAISSIPVNNPIGWFIDDIAIEEAPLPPATPTPTATATPLPTATATPSPTPSSGLDIKINFQPSGASIPTGYLVDSGQPYGSRGNGYTYGWDIDITSTTRDRNNALSPDQRYDTLIHTQLWPGPYASAWEIELPNGWCNRGATMPTKT